MILKLPKNVETLVMEWVNGHTFHVRMIFLEVQPIDLSLFSILLHQLLLLCCHIGYFLPSKRVLPQKKERSVHDF